MLDFTEIDPVCNFVEDILFKTGFIMFELIRGKSISGHSMNSYA